jgi:hypothetical protein
VIAGGSLGCLGFVFHLDQGKDFERKVGLAPQLGELGLDP